MISVIVATLNEEKYIEHVIDFFINAEPKEKELLIVDGGSTDKTKEIVKSYEQQYDNVKLLENPHQYSPHAFNIGIKNSKGDYIAIMGAHSEYPSDYFTQVLATFEEIKEADIVGGPSFVKYNNDFQEAYSKAYSSIFLSGGSAFHHHDKKGFNVDVGFMTVKKEVFNDIGLFDERLLRNQDDEFRYRAVQMGKKIYLNPDIKLWYYPRSNFSSLYKQYFQYGLYKPLVLTKVTSGIKARHLIPALFVVYLLSLPLSIIYPIWLIPLAFYILLNFYFSFKLNDRIKTRILSLAMFFILHFSYGAGFLKGIWKLNKLKNPGKVQFPKK